MGTVSAQGSTIRVFILRRNFSSVLSMALVVRAGLHCDGSSRVKVKSRLPASSRLSATAWHLSRDLLRNALRWRWISSTVPGWIMSRYSLLSCLARLSSAFGPFRGRGRLTVLGGDGSGAVSHFTAGGGEIGHSMRLKHQGHIAALTTHCVSSCFPSCASAVQGYFVQA